MTSLPPSSKYLMRPEAPVDDGERDFLTRRLSDAYADGRISHEDYMAAIDVVYSASRLGDLVPVAERLPAAAVEVPAIVATGQLPAGHVAPARNVVPAATWMVGGVVVLLVVLAALLGILL